MSIQVIPVQILADGQAVPIQMMEPQANHGGPAVPAPLVKIVKDIHIPKNRPEINFPLVKIDDPGDTVRILTATPPGKVGLDTQDHTIFFGYFEKQDL